MGFFLLSAITMRLTMVSDQPTNSHDGILLTVVGQLSHRLDVFFVLRCSTNHHRVDEARPIHSQIAFHQEVNHRLYERVIAILSS